MAGDQVVIILDTAFIKKLSTYLAPVSRPSPCQARKGAFACPKHRRLGCACRHRLDFPNNALDALDVAHLLALSIRFEVHSPLRTFLGHPVCCARFSIPGALVLGYLPLLSWVLRR